MIVLVIAIIVFGLLSVSFFEAVEDFLLTAMAFVCYVILAPFKFIVDKIKPNKNKEDKDNDA